MILSLVPAQGVIWLQSESDHRADLAENPEQSNHSVYMNSLYTSLIDLWGNTNLICIPLKSAQS